MKLLSVAVFVLMGVAVVHAFPEKSKEVSVSFILDQCAYILKSMPKTFQRMMVDAIAKIGGIKIGGVIKIVEGIRGFIDTVDGAVNLAGSVVIKKMRYLLDVILTIMSGYHKSR